MYGLRNIKHKKKILGNNMTSLIYEPLYVRIVLPPWKFKLKISIGCISGITTFFLLSWIRDNSGSIHPGVTSE